MAHPEKTQAIDNLKQLFDRMTSAVFVDFTGMNVEEVSKLRNTFRAKGVTYKVAKNTLVRHALSERPYAGKLGKALAGMTGIAWSFDEPSVAARVIKEFIVGNEKLKIKAGLLDGQVLDAQAVENQLATLPSKDEARAQLLATLNAPAQRFVMLLNTPAGNFVRALNAKQAKG